MEVKAIRNEYIKSRGDSSFNKYNINYYTDFLENKIEDLTKENEKLKKDKRRMAIDCQIMMEDRDNKYIENKQLKDLLKDK